MAELTGVPASTWEAIIARESNGQVNAANASGASGLSKLCQVGDQQLQWMIKSNQLTMPILTKDFQLGVLKQKEGFPLFFDMMIRESQCLLIWSTVSIK